MNHGLPIYIQVGPEGYTSSIDSEEIEGDWLRVFRSGEEMVVELLHYHRKETRFSSVEALQAQLFQDIEFGKQYVTNVLSH